ncbi:lytic murein transglycosylase [Herbiconiux sp. CPCC 203407]|uniref:Lytic murein transglycosylase n=1 Tax=Herbiconiux oxytropis TaxID=2970915 RepID=A0AA41XHN9_9MICO|nr:lytic murein transglycosylase [Herbiconiux oxytropis]MCS5722510.1 lytic murein transglycosylase [Herbiconiux oxytropis]MCS5726450.1 lytic murein transglycosylase [Herbiconiux oxytropis]
MSARVGLGVVVSGMLALAAWLLIGMASADAGVPAEASVLASAAAGESTGADGRATPMGNAGGGVGAGAGTGSNGAGDLEESGNTGTSAGTGGSSAAATGTGGPVPHGQRIADLVDPAWAESTAVATGIPLRALAGYAGASLALAADDPGCGLGWNTLAALGAVESGHGTHGGSTITTDGSTVPPILGPSLDGAVYDRIDDTDGGRLDGDPTGDRAAGPLQFIPGTWAEWGVDGDGDGLADPQRIDDAALAAGRYLCHYGDLADPTTWRTAVFAYNHVETYVDLIAATANDYAARASAAAPATPAAPATATTPSGADD